MRLITNLVPVLVLAIALSIPTNRQATETPLPKQAMQCLFQYEKPLGNNKLCYFDCGGTLITTTIPWWQTCPLFINV